MPILCGDRAVFVVRQRKFVIESEVELLEFGPGLLGSKGEWLREGLLLDRRCLREEDWRFGLALFGDFDRRLQVAGQSGLNSFFIDDVRQVARMQLLGLQLLVLGPDLRIR